VPGVYKNGSQSTPFTQLASREGDFFVKRSTRIFFFKPIAEAVQPVKE
jgi:hypothetical protein